MSDARPNILFLFTDDQRFDTIHALGNKQIHTPALDSLVARGTTFTEGHIMGGTSPAVCMPSRAMLHTGRSLFHLEGLGEQIPDEHALLGETLRQSGYQTYGIGKWHNGKASLNRSFEDGAHVYFGGMCDHWNVPAYHYDPTGRYAQTLPICVDPMTTNQVRWRPCDHVEAGKHSSELFGDAAVRFLQTYDGKRPFYVYLSFMAPHDPRTMPREYLERYDPEEIDLPPNFLGGHPFDNGELKVRDELLEDWPRTPEAIRRHLAEYYAMITHADAQMGRVLEALRESGQEDNTIVVFAGDNGLALGQHGLMGKQSTYEHSVHVPLILSGPGIPQGERRDALCYLLDLFPTLCELVGIDTPPTVEGKSLVPALRDPECKIRDTLFFAYRHLHRSVRDRRWKLIEYVVEGRRTTQLFDLQQDPWERKDLSTEPACSEHLQRLREELVQQRHRIGDSREREQAFWDGYEKQL